MTAPGIALGFAPPDGSDTIETDLVMVRFGMILNVPTPVSVTGGVSVPSGAVTDTVQNPEGTGPAGMYAYSKVLVELVGLFASAAARGMAVVRTGAPPGSLITIVGWVAALLLASIS